MNAAALWWVNAFVGPEAAGSATSVVLIDRPWDSAECLRVARALRAPDTVFISRTGDDLAARFFSPHEGEMAFCGQGLIAADAVLRDAGVVQAGADLVLQTSVGPVRTLVAADTGESFCCVPRALVKRVASNATIRSLLPLADPMPPEQVVDSGRKRLFKQVSEIDAIALEPAFVVEFCARHELSGVCFYAPIDAHTLRLRVFTVSFAGAEDASTGGAVLGLSALLSDVSSPIEVLQGAGNSTLRRGRLLLQLDAREVRVGGVVELVAQGRLR